MKTAAHYEAERIESQDRCDTDGFLSQWASGVHRDRARMQEDIDQGGGMATFTGLYDTDGFRVAARLIESKFGHCWLLRDDEKERFGRRFIPFGENSRVQSRLGLRQEQETAPGEATIVGKGYGLSGSAWATVERTGCEWGLDAATPS